MRTLRFFLAVLVAELIAGCTQTRVGEGKIEHQAGPAAALPGRQADGSVLLHNQWSLRPAGRQIELADFPVNIALHPGGRFAAVLHAGFSRHQVLMIDLESAAVVSRTPVRVTFYGITFSPDGKRLYCSGAADECVHAFDFADGQLSNGRELRLRDAQQRAIVAGLAVTRAGARLYAANVWGHRITRVDLAGEPKATDIPLGTNISALAIAPVTPSSDFETAAATKRAQATLYPSEPGDTFPYACLVDDAHARLYVSLWAQAKVAVLDLNTDRVQALWSTEDHPCEMVLSPKGTYLFVANANRNTVTVFETATGRTLETIWAALYPKSPPGSTPNSLALTPDGKTLFVANADNNAVAVFDVSTPGKSRPMGFIPAGWYPTSVRVTHDGKHLLIANGRGATPKANPLGPQPGVSSRGDSEYIGRLYSGTLSVIEIPSRKEFEKELASYTAQAYAGSPLKSNSGVTLARPAGNPVPGRVGESSPIKYCIYIIKENRTYDQVLGDMKEGNGDANLCLFPERITPNHHKLARDFVLLDNFYVNSEVSADGHEWSMGAYATDFVKKMWPLSYGHNSSGKFPYPSEGNFPIASPVGGYLWDRARAAGVSYRSYGEFVSNGRTPQDPARCRLKSLVGHFDEWFRSFDLAYPDQKRADRFISELQRFEQEGEMPRLQIVRLPNDHTQGTTPKAFTPVSLVADNDLALGRVIEAISQSRFWPKTAVFVLEDDAQNGPDHVDAHRSPAFVISPYSRRGAVDSTMYSTTSMLRTMELILGLQPMTQYDAAATPMYHCFQRTPDLTGYKALPANVSLDERNPTTAWGAGFEMNFSVEDAVDDLLLNEVVWRSVRGAHSPMPAPVRAAFVFPRATDDDDDE